MDLSVGRWALISYGPGEVPKVAQIDKHGPGTKRIWFNESPYVCFEANIAATFATRVEAYDLKAGYDRANVSHVAAMERARAIANGHWQARVALAHVAGTPPGQA